MRQYCSILGNEPDAEGHDDLRRRRVSANFRGTAAISLVLRRRRL
jgi:hypothetical protein